MDTKIEGLHEVEISAEELFAFHCTKYGKCCRDLGNILLTPKDMYDMAKELGLSMAAFKEAPCDLVLLDIMMLGTDGIGILRELRKISKAPVILLTAKDTDSDYYNGLLLGSGDYITKPFKPMILSAKIHALLRRIQYENQSKEQKEAKDLDCGNLHYSVRRHEFQVNGETLRLTPTERKYLVIQGFQGGRGRLDAPGA